MADEKISNKMITTILALVIIIATATVIYVNLPEDKSNQESEDETNQQTEEEELLIILNITFGDEVISYTLEELEDLESYTATGTMIKVGWLPDVVTEGPNEFTGVKISTILDEIENLPENYSIIAHSSDGRTTDYTKDNITGNIDVYNESGIIIENSGSTMILAYKIDGEYFEEDAAGPIRIVFCNENYTASSLWAKMIDNIEIIEE